MGMPRGYPETPIAMGLPGGGPQNWPQTPLKHPLLRDCQMGTPKLTPKPHCYEAASGFSKHNVGFWGADGDFSSWNQLFLFITFLWGTPKLIPGL